MQTPGSAAGISCLMMTRERFLPMPSCSNGGWIMLYEDCVHTPAHHKPHAGSDKVSRTEAAGSFPRHPYPSTKGHRFRHKGIPQWPAHIEQGNKYFPLQ